MKNVDLTAFILALTFVIVTAVWMYVAHFG
jgi:hypothetical protein